MHVYPDTDQIMGFAMPKLCAWLSTSVHSSCPYFWIQLLEAQHLHPLNMRYHHRRTGSNTTLPYFRPQMVLKHSLGLLSTITPPLQECRDGNAAATVVTPARHCSLLRCRRLHGPCKAGLCGADRC